MIAVVLLGVLLPGAYGRMSLFGVGPLLLATAGLLLQPAASLRRIAKRSSSRALWDRGALTLHRRGSDFIMESARANNFDRPWAPNWASALARAKIR